MRMRTGTRWARRTKVKIGLTDASPAASGVRVRDIDAAREPLNPAAQHGAISHELDRRGVAFLDPAESGLLEIGVDPVQVGVDDRKLKGPDIGVVAKLGGKIGDIAVDRGPDLRALKIDARLVEIRERRLVIRLGGGRLADVGLPLLLVTAMSLSFNRRVISALAFSAVARVCSTVASACRTAME